MAIFTLTNVGLTLLALLATRRIYWECTTGTRRRALRKKHACKPAFLKKLRYPFGLDSLLADQKAFREHRLLDRAIEFMQEDGVHTIDLQMLGQQIFVTDDPENIKTMLATDFEKWTIGRERMGSFLGKGIFTSEGPDWKHSREMIRPCFERSQVSDISILDRHARRLLGLLELTDGVVDLQPLLYKFALDVASEFLLGTSTESLDPTKDDGEAKEFVEAFEKCVVPFEADEVNLWLIVKMLLPSRKAKRYAKVLAAFVDKYIDLELAQRERSEKPKNLNRYVFLDELLTTIPNRVRVRSELLNILLAGRDTTASMLSNIMWILSRHPEIQARLRREIIDVVGDDDVPTWQQLKDMRFLKAIINECQRLYPTVPSNGREAAVDTIFPRGGGPDESAPVFVPKGSFVTYHPIAMHRRKDIFGEDADEFKPERWLDGENGGEPLRPGWAYVPFSGGPRVCIGQGFALTETSFLTVRLLQRFPVLESADINEPWVEKLNITASNLNGCKVRLQKEDRD